MNEWLIYIQCCVRGFKYSGCDLFFFFGFEVQLYLYQMSSKVGSSGMFHRLSTYLLLKYVYLLRVSAFLWSLLLRPGRSCRMLGGRMHHMTACGFSVGIVGAASRLLGHGFPISL